MNLLKTLLRHRSLPSSSLFLLPRAAFAETSREIEHRMRQERNKQLNNKFRALQTHFGLKRPQSISLNYPKPSSFQYSIESLRKNSHMYPEYLLVELSNTKSQYYEVIEKLIDGLADGDNKEVIEFLEFLISWKIYSHREEYGEILMRKIFQMEMDLSQLFRILKAVVHVQEPRIKDPILIDIENKILKKTLEIEHHEYQSLFRILNFMRVHDLTPKVKPETLKEALKKTQKQAKEKAEEEGQKQQKEESNDEPSFFKVLQGVLLRNLNEIPLPNLVQMIVHYANNVKESHDDKIDILSKTEQKVIQNMAFFTHDQLIAVMYSYLKTATHSQKLIQEFSRRVELLYFEISWQNKRRILSLASSLPHDKWLAISALGIHEVLKGKKVLIRDKIETDPNAKEVEYQLLPAIYLSAHQTNLLTAQLVDKLQSRILQNIFNYPSEDIGLITWLFTITPHSLAPSRQNRDLLYTKIEAVIVGGFNGGSFTLKDVAMVVWSLCNYGGKSSSVYKENADFWKNVESYIQERISNKREERLLNGCCQVLWAYLNNKSLTLRTINMITDVLVERSSSGALGQELFNFQLIMITSFYYSLRNSLPPSIFKFISQLSLKHFTILLPEMDYLEIMKMLKFILADDRGQTHPDTLSREIWEQIIAQFQVDLERVEYPYIMGVVGFVIVSPLGRATDPKAVHLVNALMARKKKLEQLKITTHLD